MLTKSKLLLNSLATFSHWLFRNKAANRAAARKQLEQEVISLHIAYIQFASLKALRTILSSSKFAELLLVPLKLADDKKEDEIKEVLTDIPLKEALQDVLRYSISENYCNSFR